jgi:diamine N-acetyltransferase
MTLMDTPPPTWLQGERVGLGPYVRELVEEYWRWENDPSTILGFGRQLPESLESRTAGIDIQLSNSAFPRFTVYDLATGRPVGKTELTTDDVTRSAEFVINIAPEAQGKSFGTEATWLTLDYAFHLISLRMVWLKVLEHNTGAIKAYEKAGFKPAGRLRQAGYWLGQPCDELFMDAIPTEFPGDSAVLSRFTKPHDNQ